MDVVGDSADANGRTPEVIRGRSEIGVEILPDGGIGEVGFAVLCRENQMNKDASESDCGIYNNSKVQCIYIFEIKQIRLRACCIFDC
jgi:hypothetical protein